MPINFTIDENSKTPPFEQIKQQVLDAVRSGSAQVDEKLPAIRPLATQLGLAVNTVARSYRELEELGAVITSGRSGTRISAHAVGPEIALRQHAHTFAHAAQGLGITLEDALAAVKDAWNA